MKITDEMRESIDDAISANSSGGTIDQKKVGMLFRACGLNPTEAQMSDWKKETGGGDVAVDKFKSIVIKKFEASGDSQDEIIDAFSVFDKDGSGMIPATEFKHICTAMGEALSEKEMAEVMREIHIESGGMINYRMLAEQIYHS
jgi:calmodulin